MEAKSRSSRAPNSLTNHYSSLQGDVCSQSLQHRLHRSHSAYRARHVWLLLPGGEQEMGHET